jgi:hypothetical protein
VLFDRWRRLHPALCARLDGARRRASSPADAPREPRCAPPGRAARLVCSATRRASSIPVTGFGMAQALLSAELLARVVAPDRALAASWDRLQDFDRRRRALLRDGALLTRLVLALARRPVLARARLRLLNHAPDTYAHLVGVAGARARYIRTRPGQQRERDELAHRRRHEQRHGP